MLLAHQPRRVTFDNKLGLKVQRRERFIQQEDFRFVSQEYARVLPAGASP